MANLSPLWKITNSMVGNNWGGGGRNPIDGELLPYGILSGGGGGGEFHGGRKPHVTPDKTQI